MDSQSNDFPSQVPFTTALDGLNELESITVPPTGDVLADDGGNDSDEDSAIGDMVRPNFRDSTHTLDSACYDFELINGRTFQECRKYFFPNDEGERDRLDFQHEIFLLTLETLQLAPITLPQNVLDIGTGTGLWALDFGDKNPQAEVIGIDLSPIQPTLVAPNVKFEIDDMLDQWNFSQKFDYIHGRMLFSWFEKRLIKSACDFLKPGGFLELQDAVLPLQSDDGTLDSTHLDRWMKQLIDLAAKENKDWTCASRYMEYMQEAGFVDVCEIRYKWPINPWERRKRLQDLGRCAQDNLLTGLQAFSTYLLHKDGMSAADIEVKLIDVRKDIKNCSIRAYLPIVVVYGRKPM